MKTVANRLAWALGFCGKVQLRVTPARELILSHLAAHSVPISFEALRQAERLRGRLDAATVYRTLMLLKESEVVRQVGLPQKASYFVLNAPDALCQYLICRRCGSISELQLETDVEKLAQGVAASRGFTGTYYELEVYGICPACRSKMNSGRIVELR